MEYPAQEPVQRVAQQGESAVIKSEAPQEHGGRIGPDPTRYGDWEKGGRCIDF